MTIVKIIAKADLHPPLATWDLAEWNSDGQLIRRSSVMEKVVVGFDIYRDFGEGLEPEQLLSTMGLETAKARVERIAAESPGRYFVWDPATLEVVAMIDSLVLLFDPRNAVFRGARRG